MIRMKEALERRALLDYSIPEIIRLSPSLYGQVGSVIRRFPTALPFSCFGEREHA
jgi:hypothetical protein